MSLMRNLAGGAAYLAYRAAYHAAVEAIKKIANDLVPLLEGVAQGQFVISQARIQSMVNKKISDVEGIDSLEVFCEEGALRLVAKCKKGLAKYEACFKSEIVELKVGKEKLVAEFQFADQYDIEGRNWAGKMTSVLAYAMVSNLVTSEDTAEKVSAKTDGMVEMDWPLVRVHLDKHPVVVKANSLRAGQFTLWDLAEVTGCRVEEGRVVLLLESPALNKLNDLKQEEAPKQTPNRCGMQ